MELSPLGVFKLSVRSPTKSWAPRIIGKVIKFKAIESGTLILDESVGVPVAEINFGRSVAEYVLQARLWV